MTQHIGLALQRLRKTPGFSLVALLALAAGIGLNLLIFAFTSPALLKALPYPDADRLLDVSMAPPGRPEARGAITPALYALLRDKTSAAFEAIGVFDAGRTANLAGDAGGLAERVAGHRISASGMAALGTPPHLGRLPVRADEQAEAPPTMVLSYGLWQKRFGGRADIVNQAVKVDGQSVTVIGVMPEGFGLLDNSSDAWFTSSFDAAPGQEFQHNLRGIGRLKPGVSMAEAQAAVKTVLDEYAATFPTRDRGWTLELTGWRDARFGGLRQPLTLVQLAMGAILLLLAVSVGLLLRARTAADARPAALAAGPQSAGVVLAESLLLSFGATVVAIGLVAFGLPSLLELTPRVLPRLDEVGLGGGVLLFALVLALATGLVVGIVPALRVARPVAVSSGAGVWLGRLSALVVVALVAVQMTLAFVLLAGTGLGIRAYRDLHGRDIGINTDGLLSADVYLPRDPYVTPNVTKAGSIDLSEYSPEGPAVYDRIRAALQTMPGVEQAAAVGTQPFSNPPFVQFWIDDLEHSPDNQVTAQYLAVTENYFNTMGLRLVGGRDFAATDRPDSPWVVLVNETLAKQQWPDGNAIGRRVTLTFHPEDGEAAREVVGVVADTMPFRGASEVAPIIYVLHRQQSAQQRASLEGRRTVMSFIVRTSGDPLALGEALRATVGKVDMTTPVTSIKTVEALSNGGQVGIFEFAATLLGTIAMAAVVIAAAGVFGLTAYGVAQRRAFLTLLLRAVVPLGIGVVVGRMVWLRLAGVIESFLTNLTVTPSDPGPLNMATGVLAMATLVALLAAAMRRPTAGR